MRSLSKLLISIFLSLSVLCTCGDVHGAAYQAGVYILNQDMTLRDAPKKTGKFLNTIRKGTKVTVKKVVETKWGQVTYKKKTGYISLKYARLVKAGKKKKTTAKTTKKTQTYKKGTYQLTAQRAVRASPKDNGKYLGTLKKGTKIVVKAVKNTKWGQVTYEKKTAYVSLKDAKYLNASTKTDVSKPKPKTIAGMLAASKTGKKTNQIITVIPNGRKSRGYRLYNVI
ncbi:MAG: SH3 domain-containing protein, partial [bacterium]